MNILTQQLIQRNTPNDGRSKQQRYNDGFDAYCDGAALDELHDEYERRGWWNANGAQAQATMPQAVAA